MIMLNIIWESLKQAGSQLWGNKLRSVLSLLGISIGIFCIISVQSAVDSLENNIKSSFDKLGNDVLYISKMPWGEDPNQNWWKYFQRPNPNYDDLRALKERSEHLGQAALSYFIGSKVLKYRNDYVKGVFSIAVTNEYPDIINIDLEKGRFWSRQEYERGTPVVVLGAVVTDELFGELEPIGKEVKMMGKKLTVIGVIEKSGNDLINPVNFDEVALVTRPFGRQVANLNSSSLVSTSLMAKAKSPEEMESLQDEAIWILRAERRLSPKQENNFAINTLSVLSKILDAVFGTLSIAGYIIGGFAIFVGIFSVANIMFVSVRERTKLIGIKKAIGAKRFIILLEFLIESVVLCLVGGGIGLFFVALILWVLSAGIGFEMNLTLDNILFGLTLATVVGILSGIIPAWIAARLDPVEAIRK